MKNPMTKRTPRPTRLNQESWYTRFTQEETALLQNHSPKYPCMYLPHCLPVEAEALNLPETPDIATEKASQILLKTELKIYKSLKIVQENRCAAITYQSERLNYQSPLAHP